MVSADQKFPSERLGFALRYADQTRRRNCVSNLEFGWLVLLKYMCCCGLQLEYSVFFALIHHIWIAHWKFVHKDFSGRTIFDKFDTKIIKFVLRQLNSNGASLTLGPTLHVCCAIFGRQTSVTLHVHKKWKQQKWIFKNKLFSFFQQTAQPKFEYLFYVKPKTSLKFDLRRTLLPCFFLNYLHIRIYVGL